MVSCIELDIVRAWQGGLAEGNLDGDYGSQPHYEDKVAYPSRILLYNPID
jgi:hypothetical protein